MKIRLHQNENGELEQERIEEPDDLSALRALGFRSPNDEPDTTTAAGRRAKIERYHETIIQPQERAFREFLRGGKDAISNDLFRAQSVGTGSAGGYLAPQSFGDRVFSMMKDADQLFDPAVTTMIETERGTPCPFPLSDDTSGAAEIVSENNPFTVADIGAFDQLLLAKADTWRTNLQKCSLELVQDSGFDLDQFLAAAFAKRFARGVGVSLVTTLAAGAASGVSAGASAITPDNLFDLFGSVNEAYLGAPKCAWAMRLSTFVTISKLKDTAGLPVFPISKDADGNFSLLTRPVRFCPAVAAIGTTNKSVFFGDMSYMVQRRVANSVSIRRLDERFADVGAVGYFGYMRVSSGFAKASGADSPVKYLVHA